MTLGDYYDAGRWVPPDAIAFVAGDSTGNGGVSRLLRRAVGEVAQFASIDDLGDVTNFALVAVDYDALTSEEQAEMVANFALKSRRPTLLLLSERNVQEDLALLFGPDVAALVWPDTLTGIEYGRTRLEHAQRRAIRSGGVVGASLVDIRSDAITAFDYTEVLTMIPADIPAYVVMFDRERGVHGVGVFLLLNGRVRYISGLERFPAFIRDLHAQAPAAATSDTAAPTQD